MVLNIMAWSVLAGCYLYWLYCAKRSMMTDGLNRPIIPASDSSLIFGGYALCSHVFAFNAGLGIGGWFQPDKNRKLPAISMVLAFLGLLVGAPVAFWLSD